MNCFCSPFHLNIHVRALGSWLLDQPYFCIPSPIDTTVFYPRLEYQRKNNLAVSISGKIGQRGKGLHNLINWANKTDGVFSNLEEPSEVNRIVSFGMINPGDGEEIFYFPLDSQRETCYYFFMNREALGTPGVIEKINNQIKQRNEQSSFKIIESDWETNHVYFESFTNIIQKTQINTEE